MLCQLEIFNFSVSNFYFSDKKVGPVINSLHKYIKLSFKEGLKDGFVVNVQTNIQMRRWEQYYPAQPTNSDPKNRVIIFMFGNSRQW